MKFNFTFKTSWLILLIATVHLISGCKQSNTYNGRYCADVKYYNPSTGKSSEYTLTVSIEDNQLVKLDFPQGYLADEDLPQAIFSSDGKASFTISKGYEYDIEITGPESGCFTNVTKAIQCRGTTKKGIRCKTLTDNASGLCHHHHKNQ